MTNRTPGSITRSHDNLSMKIYSALLGNLPRIHREPRDLRSPQDTPFHAFTIGRQLRRASGQATRALDEARERLSRAVAKPAKPAEPSANAIVLIGPSVAARRKALRSARRIAA